MSNNKKEDNRYYNKSTLISNIVMIGFVGGIIGSFLGMVAYYFNFMDFTPKFILTSWSNHGWVKAWQGFLLTMILFGILSIVIAFLYYFLLKKVKSMVAYMLFGVVCWLLFIFAFNPMFKDLPSLAKMSGDSIITSICLFILYGVFIGYSISFDYHEYIREDEGLETKSSS